ncbi:MAG: hypothetical protein ACJAYI_002145, partial [Myxococcota bacterium]
MDAVGENNPYSQGDDAATCCQSARLLFGKFDFDEHARWTDRGVR